jgi:hypothetical protein
MLLLVLFAAFVAEAVYFLLYGRFNIDEGMHLNAGQLVYEAGLHLYRDFPFSQGPGGPYFYGAASALFGTSLGVGRSLSLLVSVAGVGALVWFACRLVGMAGGILVLLWTMVNFPALWEFTQIRTEAPSVFLALIATVAWFYRKGSALRWALAPSLLVWATTFRLTYAVPLAVVCLLVGLELRRDPRTLLRAAAIVAVNGVVAALPMLASPKESFFHVLVAQASRAERLQWSDMPFSARFWFFTRPESGFWAIGVASLVPVSLVLGRWRRGWRPRLSSSDDPATALVVLFAMAGLTYLPLLFFKVGFFQYFVNASLLLIAAVAIAVPLVARESPRQRAWVIGVVAAAWVVAAFISLRTVETWVDPKQPTIGRLAALRDEFQRLTPNGCTMMTFETHLAVETGCDVMPGLEYSYFSFFPDLPHAEARAHGVLNRRLLLDGLRRDSPEYVALTARAVEQITGTNPPKDEPPMLGVMRDRYRPLATVDVPVGPIYIFWNDVDIYARSDVMDGYSM